MTAVYIDALPVDGSSNHLNPTPAWPIYAPVIITPEVVPSYDLAGGLASISNPDLSAPVTVPFVSVPILSGPVVLSVVAAGVLGAATLFTSIGLPVLALPTVYTAVTVPSYTIASLVTALSVPGIASASTLPPVSLPAMSLPSAYTAVSLPAQALAVALTVVSIPVYDLASLVSAVSEPVIPTPTLFTANAGTSETPPYPLTHARVLYDNLLLTSTVTATAGTTPSYTLIPNTYQSWLFTGTQSITFELADQTSMDTVCISAHNLSGCTVTVTYDPLLAGSFVAFGAAKVVTKNKPLMFHLSSAVDVRRLKITVTGSGSRQVGSIYAGIALQMQRPFFSGFDRFGDSTTYSTPMTAGGNIIAREAIRKGYNNTFSFQHLSALWVETYLEPFLLKAKTTPFVLAWNLSAYPDDVWFGATASDINPTFMGIRDLYSVEWSMMSHGSV